jgi:hypothetical protein
MGPDPKQFNSLSNRRDRGQVSIGEFFTVYNRIRSAE